MSDSMKIQPAASRSVHSIAATDANDSRVNLITATPSTPTTSEVRAPASERAYVFA